MLGRHHISITMASLVPFIIPLFFIKNTVFVEFSIAFLFAAFIGSLTPDADCGGKATLFYKFEIVDWLMKKVIIKPVVFVFQTFVNQKYVLEYDVKEEHRGIMHSPVGVFISSFILTLVLVIIMLFASVFNIFFVLAIFSGLLIGQLLHLLEDSCTVSGINWKFPFATKEMKGQIYTFDKIEGKKDIRQGLFSIILYAESLFILGYYLFQTQPIAIYFIYPIVLVTIFLTWMVLINLSKSESNYWYWDAEKVKLLKKQQRSFLRNITPKDEKRNKKRNDLF